MEGVSLENLDFRWNVKEIDTVKKMWNNGDNFKNICKVTKRAGEGVLLLLLHLARGKIIRESKGFIFGK